MSIVINVAFTAITLFTVLNLTALSLNSKGLWLTFSGLGRGARV